MQTARVIEFPVTLKESIKLALREASDLSKRRSMNNYIKQIIKLCKLRKISITGLTGPGYMLQICIKKDGELLFDILNHEAISDDGNCPVCDQYFATSATILYIHQGLAHDKVIFACSCGSFYAYYARKGGDD